jgi:lipopolysaccharide export system protein LptC
MNGPPLSRDGLVQNDLEQGRPGMDRLSAAGPVRARQVPTAARIARRRAAVSLTKYALPVAALALLGSIAAWPELVRVRDQARIGFRRVASVDPGSGRLRDAHYRGVDERGRPYTITADWAAQAGPVRVNLGEPKGDIVPENGGWLMVQSHDGVYMQHSGLLDLSHEVVLYRDNGTVMRTESATLDVKTGAAASDDQTHAEGPFGVLDAQGFTLTDKGAAIQFRGPARLVLNGAEK